MIKRIHLFSFLFVSILLLSSTPMSLSRYNVSDFTSSIISGQGNILSRILWLVVFAMIVVIFLQKPIKSVFQSRLFIVLSIYIIAILFSSIASKYSGYSLVRFASLFVYLLAAPTATILVLSHQDIIAQQRMILFSMIFTLVISLALALVIPEFAIYSSRNRFVGIYSYPNMASRFAVLVLMFTWLFPDNWIRNWEKWLLWLLTPLWVLIIIITKSRSPIIGLLLVIAYVLWKKHPHLRLTVIIVTPLLMIGTFLASQYLFDLLVEAFGIFPHSSVLTIEEELFTLTGRTGLWKIIFDNFPISFIGIGYKTLFYSTNGYIIQSGATGLFGGAHSAYIEPIIETGIIGTISLVLFLFYLVWYVESLPKSIRLEMGQFRLLINSFIIFIFSQSILEGLFDNGNVLFWMLIYYGFLCLRIPRIEDQRASIIQSKQTQTIE